MRLRQMLALAAVTLLIFSPALPPFGTGSDGMAYAKNDKGGGNGNGGGNGGGNGNAGSKSAKGDKAATKSAKNADAGGGNGKMTGALEASIGSVLAHIRNGQTRSGPVGLLAGLAVADTMLGEAATQALRVERLAVRFAALDASVAKAGFKSVEEYLVIRQSGILTEAEMALIDPLIEDLGGTNAAGTALARKRVTRGDLDAAEDDLAEAQDDVAAAERAIAKAMNKEDDLATLLAALRDKLAPHQKRIADAVN